MVSYGSAGCPPDVKLLAKVIHTFLPVRVLIGIVPSIISG
jgi:hypothetical protein